jgi:hypothetical protein
VKRIEAFIYRALFFAPPTWGAIAVMLAVGVSLVAFGNLDRVFWRMTLSGASLPGLVLDVRSYRAPETDFETYVPRVAFRDLEGKIRIMETQRGSARYDLAPEQPVLVSWTPPQETVAIDVPFRRETVTTVIMSLFTALGVTSWLGGILLLLRRVSGRGARLQVGQHE